MKNYNNRTVLIILLTLLSSVVNSQDIIYNVNKTEIKSKVIEITQETIKYKEWGNQDGPIYNIPKDEVYMVQYQNGKKDYFDNDPHTQNIKKSNSIEDGFGEPKKSRIAKNSLSSKKMLLTGKFSIAILNQASMFGPGGYFMVAVNENLAFGGGLDFKFGSTSSVDPDIDETLTIAFSMITIAPTLNYYFNSAYKGFFIGPHLGINLFSAKSTIKGDGYSEPGESGSLTMISIGGSLGYNIPISSNLILSLYGTPGYMFGAAGAGGGFANLGAGLGYNF